jgi:hypothetical protein
MPNTYVNHGDEMRSIIVFINTGRLIEAVKLYSCMNCVSIKEAEDACEAIRGALNTNGASLGENLDTAKSGITVSENFAVLTRRDNYEYDWCKINAKNKADAMATAIECVKTDDDVLVVQIIAKSVTERHIKSV